MLGDCVVSLCVPCHGLVEEWVRLRFGEQSQRRITAYNIVKVRVVDVERLLSERLMGYAGPEEFL